MQVGNNLKPHELNDFQGFLAIFVTVFGILYVGHSFPAFRAKESTINYLMTPASTLEKFIFEFINRIVITLIALPLLYWVIFNIHGYFFDLFTEESFTSVGPQYLFSLDDAPPDYRVLVYSLIIGGVFFALSLAFAGAAIFTKQPLVKSLFAVALVVMFFVGYSYILIEPLGIGRYNPPEHLVLIPLDERRAMGTVSIAFFTGTLVMLFVAFRKLKEREV